MVDLPTPPLQEATVMTITFYYIQKFRIMKVQNYESMVFWVSGGLISEQGGVSNMLPGTLLIGEFIFGDIVLRA